VRFVKLPAGNEVTEVAGSGFIALWCGQYVQAIDGGLPYFATEPEAWRFLDLCDDLNGIPASPPGARL